MDDDLEDLLTPEEMAFITEELDSRFGSALSEDDVLALNQSVIPKNTRNRNQWARRLFEEWHFVRYQQPGKKFGEYCDAELKDILPRFIHEVRRKDGLRYPNTSLVSIIAGVNAALADRGINLFRDSAFKPVMDALDASMKISTREGASLPRKSAAPISFDEEELLWKHGCLGDSEPDQLRNTLFYLNGIHFALRGGEEQSNLLLSQFEIDVVNGKRVLRFHDTATKTYSGGLKDARTKVKEVIHFENLEMPSRCHVALFEKYSLLRPVGSDRFYLQSAKNWRSESMWYTTRPVGKNVLAKTVDTMCKTANISGKKSVRETFLQQIVILCVFCVFYVYSRETKSFSESHLRHSAISI